MKRDSLAFLLAGTFFGLLVGWIIGSQQGTASPVAVATAPASAPAASPQGQPQPAPVLDAAQATELEQRAKAEPKNAAVRSELANLYFDAERYDQAIVWYGAALQLDPKNVNVSTDLGVAYYYTNQVDRALAQLDHSLTLDAKHLKTLLNQGIVRAFGKQDLAGAAVSWQKVVDLGPESEEGKRAKQGLDGLKAAHQQAGSAAQPTGAK